MSISQPTFLLLFYLTSKCTNVPFNLLFFHKAPGVPRSLCYYTFFTPSNWKRTERGHSKELRVSLTAFSSGLPAARALATLRSSPWAHRDGARGLRAPQPHTGLPRGPWADKAERGQSAALTPRTPPGAAEADGGAPSPAPRRARPRRDGDGRWDRGGAQLTGTRRREAGRERPPPSHPPRRRAERAPPRSSRGEWQARQAAISYLLGRTRPGAAPHYRPRLIVLPPPPPFPRCRRLAPPNCQVPPFTWARDGLLLLLLPPLSPCAAGPTQTEHLPPVPTEAAQRLRRKPAPRIPPCAAYASRPRDMKGTKRLAARPR